METVTPTLDFSVTYKQKDISSMLAPYVTSIQYTDNLDGTADTISIELEDCDARWQGKWYPTKTDELTLSFGYLGQAFLEAGTFYIDQIGIKAPPSTVTIEGIALAIVDDLKTKRTEAYEDTTLRQIVETVAGRHKLASVGTVEDIPIIRCTQNQQSDMAFLSRLSKEYGYALAIKDKRLIFAKREELKKTDSEILVTASDCIDYSFTDKTSQVYKACEVRYWSPKLRKMLSYTESVQGLKTGDTLVIKAKLENEEQAKARAKAALTSANDRQVTGTITVVGSTQCVAGAQIKLEGFGVLSGIYTITVASHTFSRNGWTVSLSISRNELKPDNPQVITSSGTGVQGPNIPNLTNNPTGWATITDDDGNSFQCTNEAAARFNRLKELVHQRWPGQAFWVSCTTGGTHSSSAHAAGKAIDCGVDGISKTESYTLESLAKQAGFGTFNEYVQTSTYKTGDHMHIYI